MTSIENDGSPAPSPDVGPPRWWRRHAVPLVALAILLPTTVGVVGTQEWTTGRTAFDLPATAVVAAGDSIDIDGLRLGPAALEDAPGVTPPAGMRAIAASLPVEFDDDPVACSATTLGELDGDQRRWSTRMDPDWLAPADASTACPSDAIGRDARIAALFVVPEDTGALHLDVAVGDGGHLVRFELD